MQPLVLVVEDEVMVAKVTCRMIEASGYRCEWVGTGSAALTLLEAGADSVELVLVDIVLPDMPGLDLALALRERSPHVAIIFTSAYLEHRVAPPDWEGAPFLAKPYSGDELAAAIGKLLPWPLWDAYGKGRRY
jgi:two-component system cell cycle sensor histidine kinase/response regulator CckA